MAPPRDFSASLENAVAAGSSRDFPLEALRGIAAIVVVFWHFLLGLAPAVLALPDYGLHGTPLLAFVHGSAAVSVFFVLSGYVLTRRYFETGNKRILIIGALKRYARLFLPVFLSVILSWLFFQFGFYAYEEAGHLSGSDWLASFGFAMRPPFEPDLVAALRCGFGEPLYHDNNSLNPILWTIHIELMGSYIAFALAATIRSLRGQDMLILLILALGLLSTHFVEPFLAGFLAGPVLAFYAPRLKAIKASTAIITLIIGIIFLGYRDPIGFYSFFFFLEPFNGEPLRAYTSTIGAVLVMISFIGYEPLRRNLQGRFARILGRMSFPIYLVHLILICSLGSTVYVFTSKNHDHFTALALAALALIPAILILAALFAVIDIKWIAFVNNLFRRIKLSNS